MDEEWRAVTLVDFAQFYEVSSHGNVRSLPRVVVRGNGRKQTFPGKVLKQSLTNWGYFRVWLIAGPGIRKFVSVHRLVAGAFIANPDGLPEVNHTNSIKTDNRHTNLEWCTNEQNLAHAVIAGTQRYTPEHIRAQILLLAASETQQAIGDRFGLSQASVSRLIRKLRAAQH